MRQIQIGKYIISKKSPPFIVAEAGINHNGELDKAYSMIKVAKQSGADAIKFQTFKAEEFVSSLTQTYTYISQGKEITESMLEMFKRYEFIPDEWYLIKKKCDEENVLFFSTPQNRSDLDLLLDIGVPCIKVGSDDFTNLPLIKDYSQKGLPLILSCGMADLAEIYQTLEVSGAFYGYPVILLLCTSQYPTPPEDVNLLKLKTLENAFPDLILGFSDHTQGDLASSLAVAMGAVVFEKHFTLDHNLHGPDHWFSEDPGSLGEWVKSIRTAFTMMGSPIVRPTEKELINKKEFQRFIVASKDINKGDIFKEDYFETKRISSGKGLPHNFINILSGSKASRDFKKGDPIIL